MHIPKTAGTSLRRLLESQFTTAETFPSLLWAQHWQQTDAQEQSLRQRIRRTVDYRFIGGHFDYQLKGLFLPRPVRRLTVLRNPEDRALSFYHHILANTETDFFVEDATGRWHEYPRPFPSLEETLSHPVFATMFSNTMFRQFAIDYNPEELRAKPHRMGPHFSFPFVGAPLSKDLYPLVRERLAKTVVGIQEHFLVSLWLFRCTLDLPIPLDAETRERPGKHLGLSGQSAAALELLRQLNVYDRWLYERGVEQFLTHVQTTAAKHGLTPPRGLNELDADFADQIRSCP
ncbi:MAG: sulfotransferase family 2 domain-containing protein [Acidimicrobiales bacterium]|nr:sulfotransferase family 2 domain-containing protein [Acidimicrobiales bacterium]